MDNIRKDDMYEIIENVLQKIKQENQKDLNVTQENVGSKTVDMLKEHEKDLNTTIDEELKSDENGNSFISEEELKGILDEHFERVNDLIKNYHHKDSKISFSDLKSNIKKMNGQFKDSLRNKVLGKIKSVKQNIDKVKESSKNYIKNSIRKINENIKNISKKIDSKLEEGRSDKDVKSIDDSEKNKDVKKKLMDTSYAEKIEKSLRNDKRLMKSAIIACQAHSMNKHLEKSKNSIKKLDELSRDQENPIEQYKLNYLKTNIEKYVSETESKLKKLYKVQPTNKTLEKLNEKDKSIELNAQSNQSKDDNNKTKTIEKKTEIQMER